jgi:hypothetical protein
MMMFFQRDGDFMKFALLSLLLILSFTACNNPHVYIESQEEEDDDIAEWDGSEFVASSIESRLQDKIYVNANQMGFQFYESGGNLYYNLWRFGLSYEKPIKSRSGVKTAVKKQKSEGTWIINLEEHEYILNETNMRLVSYEGETLFPQKMVLDKAKESKETEEE